MQVSDSVFLMPKEHKLTRRFVTFRRRRLRNPHDSVQLQSLLFFSARNAIFWGLKALGIAPGSHILAPAYICRAAIEPVLAYGATIDFYNVTRDCQIDLADLESRIHERTSAVMVVHYFGFPQPLQIIKNLCDRLGLFLIEDCAHVLRRSVEEQEIGSVGDASIFSWRKFLPLYDGGELLIKDAPVVFDMEWSKEPFLLTLKIAKNTLEKGFYSAEGVSPHPIRMWVRVAQTVWNWLKKDGTYRNHPVSVDNNSASFDERAASLHMSRISQCIMAYSDIIGISKSRRSNYMFLVQEIGSIEGVRVLFPDLPQDVCPWTLPFFFDDLQDVHLILRRCGIPALNWDGVRPAAVSKTNFPDADFLYRNLVFLPIHQCLQPSDLGNIVKVIRAVRAGDI